MDFQIMLTVPLIRFKKTPHIQRFDMGSVNYHTSAID